MRIWSQGEGEMAWRIRDHDWNDTPLGPVQGWRQSLQLIVGVMLDAPPPTAVCWGPDHILLYNDAWAALIGHKHPGALGRPAREVFPEIWGEIGSKLTGVLADEGAAQAQDQWLPLIRGAVAEDAWFSFSLVPIRLHDGSVGGVLNIATETTERVLADRRRSEVDKTARDSEERQAFLLGLSDTLNALADPVAIQTQACRLLAVQLDVDRADYVEIDGAAGIAHVVRAGLPALAGPHRVADFAWSVAILHRRDRHVIADTQTSDLVPEPDRAALAALGITACLGTPLVKDGRLVGALYVTDGRRRDWTGGEVEIVQDVGERIWAAVGRARVEAALRESEERLALAFRTLPVGIAMLDVAGRITMANGEMRRFLPNGRIPSRDSAAVSHWGGWDADGRGVAPDDFPGARALRGEAVFPGVQMLHHGYGGSETWTEVLSTPLRDGNGRVSGAIVVVIDVDRVKRSEEATRASEERLRQFGEASQDVLWIRDAETLQWSYLTPAFEPVYGLSREKALAGDDFRGWQDLIVPEDRAHAVASIGRASAGEHVTFEYRVRRPSDGQVRWLRDTDFPMRDGTGRVVRIGGVGQDITALKAIETALTESEGRLRALVEGVSQLVWRALGRGDWTWASPQWTGYTGQAEVDSHHGGWLDPVHPGDRPLALAAWTDAEETGGFEAEYRIRNAATGEYRWFQSRAAPHRGERGVTVAWLGTSTDIHQLKGLQESQAVMVAELQHRTRNLIAVVRGIAEDTMDETGPTEAFRPALADRLSALSRVQGLLSRAEVEPIVLAAVVRLELDALGAGALGDRVTLAGPDVWLRNSTVQTLALALHELATNARKHGALSHDRGRLAVTWSERIDGGERRLLLDWLETGLEHAPARTQPASEGSGYGRELIEQALPHALGARTSYTLTETGVHCTIALPSRPDPRDGGTP